MRMRDVFHATPRRGQSCLVSVCGGRLDLSQSSAVGMAVRGSRKGAWFLAAESGAARRVGWTFRAHLAAPMAATVVG
jgi:hypothetical protein